MLGSLLIAIKITITNYSAESLKVINSTAATGDWIKECESSIGDNGGTITATVSETEVKHISCVSVEQLLDRIKT